VFRVIGYQMDMTVRDGSPPRVPYHTNPSITFLLLFVLFFSQVLTEA